MPMEEEEEEESSLSVCSSSHLRSRGEQEQQASGIRSLSLSNLFSFRIAKRASSLDMDQLHIAAAADAAVAVAAAASCAEEDEKDKMRTKQQAVCRSQSLPMTSIRRLQPHNHKKRARFRLSSVPAPALAPEALEAAAGAEEEEVGQEEAVCRICMVALWEGGSVLKLECRCKGELALAHRECAVRWFSIKGNANCDVCSHDVLNLPVTLRRIHSHSSDTSAAAPPPPALRGGLWQHGTPILVVVSMLAYFCFLEQLLVGDHGTAALAISLPFAGVLGLFSSLTTTKMVSRRYVWIYSAFQFLFIVLFTHLFYRYVRLQAVIAIILSTFAGFAVAICGNAMALQIITWRLQLRRTPVSDLET